MTSSCQQLINSSKLARDTYGKKQNNGNTVSRLNGQHLETVRAAQHDGGVFVNILHGNPAPFFAVI